MSRAPLLLRNQCLTRTALHYDLELTWKEKSVCQIRVLHRGKQVAATTLSLYEKCNHLKVTQTREGKHTFFSAMELIHFGVTRLWYVDSKTLQFKDALDEEGHAFKTEQLPEGVVQELQMAKYVFGIREIPKGDEPSTGYERLWRFNPKCLRFYCASDWRRRR